MFKSQSLFCVLIICTNSALSLWDFAVTTNSKINFYNENWQEITTAAHEFDQLSAITFDETEEILYFNDQLHNNGSIFSVKIPTSQNDRHIVERIVQRTQNESIAGIAYDPLDRTLYWTDAKNRKIYFASVDDANASTEQLPRVLVDLSAEEHLPDGIAIDICRRRLYWTNSNSKNASVERINLDGTGRIVIANKNLHLPRGIVVDQLSDRIYWVVDQEGIHFSVETANLNGSDRFVIVKGLNKIPFSLAVTQEAIYWTDTQNNAVWGHPKFSEIQNQTTQSLVSVKRFNMLKPRGIVARSYFLRNLENDIHCKEVVQKIKTRLLQPKPTLNPLDAQRAILRREYCLNGGDYSEHSGVCICKIGFKGARCETDECYNQCVHGTCEMSPMGFPKCICQHGFYGERCHSYKCNGYCFNDGLCKIETSNDEPSCECKDNFSGQRCEHNSTEVCALFCRILKHEPEMSVPFGCHDICEELVQQSENGAEIYAIPKYKHLEVCRNVATWNSTLIIVLVCGVVLCLCLVLLIVHGLRRFYKPARPRIKKTFVVRRSHGNKSSDTPLTNRPMATEQCEITIENCCNMNICDTPCFDPKLVQQSFDNNSKEDKKMLIHNMEDELY